MAHFAIVLAIVAVALCSVQRTAQLYVRRGEGMSEGGVAPAIGGFGGPPPRKFDILDLKWCHFQYNLA